MTLQEFKIWLQGFLDAKQGSAITAQDTQKIMTKLGTAVGEKPDPVDWQKVLEGWQKTPPKITPCHIPPNGYPVWPTTKPYNPNDFWPGGVRYDVFGPYLGTPSEYKLNISTCLTTGEEDVPTAGNSKGSA